MDDLSLLTECTYSVVIENTLQNSLRFLIPFFLKAHLENDVKVIFIAVENETRHYDRICRKLGFPLNTYIQSGKLILHDLLSLGENLFPDLTTVTSWERIMKIIVEKLDREGSDECDERVMVVIDSLSTLYALSDDPSAVFNFCRYCLNSSKDSGFITMINSDVGHQLCNALHHYFDFVCSAQNLDLLSIANVDGKLQITRNRLKQISINQSEDHELCLTWNLFFRIKESNISFFPSVEFEL